MRRFTLWLLAGLVSAGLTLIVFLPAAWLAPVLEAQTDGRLTLGDAQGSLWNGSAFLGAAPSDDDPVTPLLPGRFAWRLSPLALLGQVDMRIENAAALSRPVQVTGSWYRWQIGPSSVMLPAERLSALGAPLNTIQPSGRMELSWTPLQVARSANDVSVNGTTTLQMENIASRLSPIKPLGAYKLIMDWNGDQAALALSTVKGPMLLSGNGTLRNGRLQFSGKAEAEAGQEERLANLLNLLGQRRKEDGKDVIALEFK